MAGRTFGSFSQPSGKLPNAAALALIMVLICFHASWGSCYGWIESSLVSGEPSSGRENSNNGPYREQFLKTAWKRFPFSITTQ